MAGRPSIYSEDLAFAICQRLAEGESLRSICSAEEMPGKTTILRWLDENAAFRSQYARAREVQADTLADDILEIADDARNDWMERNDKDNAGWIANSEHINRSRLRVDSRKWLAAKLQPKKYGEHLNMDANVNGNMTVLFDDPTIRPDTYERKPHRLNGS